MSSENGMTLTLFTKSYFWCRNCNIKVFFIRSIIKIIHNCSMLGGIASYKNVFAVKLKTFFVLFRTLCYFLIYFCMMNLMMLGIVNMKYNFIYHICRLAQVYSDVYGSGCNTTVVISYVIYFKTQTEHS